MKTELIIKEARRIIHLCQSRDPFKIADDLGIHVMYRNDFGRLLGMYMVIDRSRFIMINANLNKQDMKTIIAHEIGHDRFHRDWAKSKALQNFGAHDMTLKPEREANIFAAEILIDDRRILEILETARHEDCSVEMLAGELDIDINILLIKLEMLKWQGYDVRVPYRVQGDFMGRM